jgi:hypothetical protein
MEAMLKEALADDQRIDAFMFWSFDDLQARRIVVTRTDLHRKQRLYGFPKPYHLTGGRRPNAVFKALEVVAWVEGRMKLEAAE